MEAKVKGIIEAAFVGAVANIERLAGGRIVGSIVWDGFDGSDDVDRQQTVGTLLRDKLGAEITEVGILLTYTPHELEVMRAA